MTDDVKERFKLRVREIAAHIVDGLDVKAERLSLIGGITALTMTAIELRAHTERAIFAGVQLAQPPNAFALSSALAGCCDYIEATAKRGAIDREKLRSIGLLLPELMLTKWREQLDKQFLAASHPTTTVEESQLPSNEPPPNQTTDK